MTMSMFTVGLSEAKANLNKIANLVNETGQSVTVFKRNRPYITISPAQETPNEETLEAMRQSEAMRNDPRTKIYRSAEELFSELGI